MRTVEMRKYRIEMVSPDGAQRETVEIVAMVPTVGMSSFLADVESHAIRFGFVPDGWRVLGFVADWSPVLVVVD